jgi:hypothetical protein
MNARSSSSVQTTSAGGELAGLIHAALRRGLTIGCAVTIGMVPGTIIGYNIARQGAYPGERYPLLVATDLGTAKCCLDEVMPAP